MVQEELLQRVITDSRAYGTLLGSGAIGDSGELSRYTVVCDLHFLSTSLLESFSSDDTNRTGGRLLSNQLSTMGGARGACVAFSLIVG